MTETLPIVDMIAGTVFEAFGGKQFVVADDRYGRVVVKERGGDTVLSGRQLVGRYGRVVDEVG